MATNEQTSWVGEGFVTPSAARSPEPASAVDYRPTAVVTSVSSKWLYENDSRLDASQYASGAIDIIEELDRSHLPKESLGSLCGTIWHPVQNQARTNFKRIYTKPEHGVPFVSSRNMFDLPLRPYRWLSRRMPKLPDLMVPEGWLVISRSGTVGNVLYVRRRLASCAITDHAIRVEPVGIEAGYLYAFLSSRYGQPLIERGVFGSTVDELEPKHLAVIPVPMLHEGQRSEIHRDVVTAYELRDQADELIAEADELLHERLGIDPFAEDDIEYLSRDLGHARAFAVSSRELKSRFDASHHVPLTRSALHKLRRTSADLESLGNLCSSIVIPGRFKRNYVPEGAGVPYLIPSQLYSQRPVPKENISRRQAASHGEYLLTRDQLLLTTDGTIGRVHPVTRRLEGWFGSNNMARLKSSTVDLGYLYTFLSTPFGQHQVAKDVYGGVIDHINESHIASVLVPTLSAPDQRAIGDLVRRGFDLKDEASTVEEKAIGDLEAAIAGSGPGLHTT